MKTVITIFAMSLIIGACKNRDGQNKSETGEVSRTAEEVENEQKTDNIDIDPISHATAVITWDQSVIYIDPVGGAEAFNNKPKPDLVLVTDIHGDHMDAATLRALELQDTPVVVPQAVKTELPSEMEPNLVVLRNGDSREMQGFQIRAIPMYNLPEDEPEPFHPKGRGNGYVLEKENTRLYISGDTEDIPEMRNLEDIDIAFVAMNLPYTMDVEQAAEGVLAFEPDKVYPYHYRGKDGFADVERFRELVNQENQDIEVELLEWYPEEK